jgi:hypothetical protein
VQSWWEETSPRCHSWRQLRISKAISFRLTRNDWMRRERWICLARWATILERGNTGTLVRCYTTTATPLCSLNKRRKGRIRCQLNYFIQYHRVVALRKVLHLCYYWKQQLIPVVSLRALSLGLEGLSKPWNHAELLLRLIPRRKHAITFRFKVYGYPSWMSL